MLISIYFEKYYHIQSEFHMTHLHDLIARFSVLITTFYITVNVFLIYNINCNIIKTLVQFIANYKSLIYVSCYLYNESQRNHIGVY